MAIMPAGMNIPLFPLNTVLFPGGSLPLQIFEVRYLDMVQRCHDQNLPFGVVCLIAGDEVQRRGQGETFEREQFHPVGTLARIVSLEQPQPGLLLITCEGQERFQVEHSEKLPHGLWTADVSVWTPEPYHAVPLELRHLARQLRQIYDRLQAEHPDAILPHPPWNETQGPWQDAGWVANRWAEMLPLRTIDRQRLLALESPLLRLELIGDALEQLGLID